MLFHNPSIPLEDLPALAEVEENKPERGLLKLSMIWAAIISFFLLLSATVVSFTPAPTMVKVGIWIGMLTIAGFLFLAFAKGYHRKAYSLRGHDLSYRSGWLWHKITTVPFSRVQHVEVDQGPIERALGLATLKVFTAGGSSSDLSVPGLSPERAKEMKTFILQKITGHDA
ncbi:MAG: PH domain-containing protein [Bacteroidota bacterium]